MNKFIILFCFVIAVSFHILLLTYHRNFEPSTIDSEKNTTIQLQMAKIKQIQEMPEIKKEKVQEKIVEEKKEVFKKENKKVEIPKEKIKTPIQEQTNKIEEQTFETKNSSINNTISETKTPLTQINFDEQKYINEYSTKLRAEINKNKEYPTISKKLKEEGKVIISFKVLRNGQFTNIRVDISSGIERLDKAALNALYETKEFESFGSNINNEYLDFILPLEFTLY